MQLRRAEGQLHSLTPLWSLLFCCSPGCVWRCQCSLLAPVQLFLHPESSFAGQLSALPPVCASAWDCPCTGAAPCPWLYWSPSCSRGPTSQALVPLDVTCTTASCHLCEHAESGLGPLSLSVRKGLQSPGATKSPQGHPLSPASRRTWGHNPLAAPSQQHSPPTVSLQVRDEDVLWDRVCCDGFLKGMREAPLCRCCCGLGCLGMLLCGSLGCVMRVPHVEDTGGSSLGAAG